MVPAVINSATGILENSQISKSEATSEEDRIFQTRYRSFHLRKVTSSVLARLRKSPISLLIAEKHRVNVWFTRNALGESDVLCDSYDRGRITHANMSFPERRPRGFQIANRSPRVGEARWPFLLLSRSEEMGRKLIGAVNVNTRMDVRDRKSGLANWLTVSPLYLPVGDSALRAPPSFSSSLLQKASFRLPDLRRSISISSSFSPSPAPFRLTTDQIERSYAVRACIWPAVWISDLSACNFRTVESALRHSHVRDCRSSVRINRALSTLSR